MNTTHWIAIAFERSFVVSVLPVPAGPAGARLAVAEDVFAVAVHHHPRAALRGQPHDAVHRHLLRGVRPGRRLRRREVRRRRRQPLLHEPRAELVRGGVEREPAEHRGRELVKRADERVSSIAAAAVTSVAVVARADPEPLKHVRWRAPPQRGELRD